MIIRKKQQNQLAVNLFIERLKHHWLGNFPHKFSSLSGDEINRLAQKALRETQSKGIEKEDEIVIYTDLCLVSFTGFASQLKPREELNA